MTREEYRRIEAFMKTRMTDSAHDPEHIYRVLYLALDIAGFEEKVDYDVLIAACLLHDIGRELQFKNPELCHAECGGTMAYDYLIKEGWAEGKAEHVGACVQSHRYRSGHAPKSTEAKILFDSDKLDVTGAMGIARTILFAGRTDCPLYSVEDGRVLDGHEEIDSFFSEYQFKLRGLYDKFYTKRAAKLAALRRPAAERFFEDLSREADESYRGAGLLERLL